MAALHDTAFLLASPQSRPLPAIKQHITNATLPHLGITCKCYMLTSLNLQLSSNDIPLCQSLPAFK